MSRIARRFARLKAEGRAGLVTFITAGDPDLDRSQALLNALPAAGADIIELGMPFTDPMADGPAIQEASQRALKAGATMDRTLAMAAAFRRTDAETPMILMGYANPVLARGYRRFAADAAAAGVDGLILVDLPPEEDGPLRAAADAEGLAIIRLATPTTDAQRLPRVLDGASGFLYYVAVAGVTGSKQAAQADVGAAIAAIRPHTDLPIAVGFGVRTPDQAADLAAYADAVVVGSAIVSIVKSAQDQPDLLDKCVAFVQSLRQGIGAAQRQQTG